MSEAPVIDRADSMLVLGMDTCGPAGSVALARVAGGGVELLGQTGLEGRTYSATLVAAIAALLEGYGLALHQVECVVVVNGPGSFTGVRVGVSAAKGLALGAGVPLLAVSRLAVLAHKAGVPNAALDAHRREVFLRADDRELLADGAELATKESGCAVAVCDDAAAALVNEAWPGARIVRVEEPSAFDAIAMALPRILEREFDDAGLLDGHYLRRSDAEIFGDKAARK